MDIFEAEVARRFVVAVEKIANALDRKTEPTSSKMEQVETMSCQECKWWFTDSLKHGGYCQSFLYNQECSFSFQIWISSICRLRLHA